MQRKDDIDRRVCMAQREHTCFNAATTTTTSMPPRLRWGFPPASAHWLWSAASSRAVAASPTCCWQHSRMRPGACCSACVRAQFCIPSCSEARRSRRVCVCVFVCARDRRLVVLPRSHRVMPCCACDAFGKEHDGAAAASARERGAVQEPQEVCIQRSEARRSSFTALHFTLDRTGRVSLLPPHICDCMSRITTRPSLVSCTCGTRRCRWRTCWPGLDGADTTRRLRSCTDILLTHREPASVWRAFSC
jgi:hypothetical protein